MSGPESVTTIPDLEGETIQSACLETDGHNGWLRIQTENGMDLLVKAEYCSLTEYPLFSSLEGHGVVVQYTPDSPETSDEQ